jgi:heme/copper-type cytochrome/quinol oxidase subunit 3
MKERIVLDVSTLPTTGFGPRTTPWWGTLAFVGIEGAGFALAIGMYLYLVYVNGQWPLNAQPPNHWPATILTLLLLASLWPNARADADAHKLDLRRTRLWLVVGSLVGVAALGIRAYEFANLNVMWDANAYGSVIWFILGLHTTHLLTDVGDTIVLTVLMFTRHATERRFGDVSDNAFYWYFVVGSWLPLYGLVYWAPRLGIGG